MYNPWKSLLLLSLLALSALSSTPDVLNLISITEKIERGYISPDKILSDPPVRKDYICIVDSNTVLDSTSDYYIKDSQNKLIQIIKANFTSTGTDFDTTNIDWLDPTEGVGCEKYIPSPGDPYPAYMEQWWHKGNVAQNVYENHSGNFTLRTDIYKYEKADKVTSGLFTLHYAGPRPTYINDSIPYRVHYYNGEIDSILFTQHYYRYASSNGISGVTKEWDIQVQVIYERDAAQLIDTLKIMYRSLDSQTRDSSWIHAYHIIRYANADNNEEYIFDDTSNEIIRYTNCKYTEHDSLEYFFKWESGQKSTQKSWLRRTDGLPISSIEIILDTANSDPNNLWIKEKIVKHHFEYDARDRLVRDASITLDNVSIRDSVRTTTSYIWDENTHLKFETGASIGVPNVFMNVFSHSPHTVHVIFTSTMAENSLLEVLNLQGKCLKRISLSCSTQSIQLRNLPSGIALFRLKTNDRLTSVKHLILK